MGSEAVSLWWTVFASGDLTLNLISLYQAMTTGLTTIGTSAMAARTEFKRCLLFSSSGLEALEISSMRQQPTCPGFNMSARRPAHKFSKARHVRAEPGAITAITLPDTAFTLSMPRSLAGDTIMKKLCKLANARDIDALKEWPQVGQLEASLPPGTCVSCASSQRCTKIECNRAVLQWAGSLGRAK